MRTYIFGGFLDNEGSTIPASRAVYVFKGGQWQDEFTTLPVGLTHAGIARIGGTVYLAGGAEGDYESTPGRIVRTVRTYNTSTREWGTTTPLPSARAAGGLVAVDDGPNGAKRLHFFGGVDSNRNDKGEHWALLPGSGSWTLVANMNSPRNHFGVAVTSSPKYILAIGGQDDWNGDSEFDRVRSDVIRYNFSEKRWESAASLPKKLGHTTYSTVVTDGALAYVFGGSGANRADTQDVLRYDATNNTWSDQGDLPVKRSTVVAGVTPNGNFLIATGRCNGSCNLPSITPHDETWESQGR